MFDKNDFYVKAFGPVEGWKPVDAAAFEGLLYVVDEKNSEIKIFDIQAGALRNTIGKKGEDAQKSQLGLPTNLAFDREGYLYVSDMGRFQIVKLDRDGRSRATSARSAGCRAPSRGRRASRWTGRTGSMLLTRPSTISRYSPRTATAALFRPERKRPRRPRPPRKVALDYDNVKYFQQYADPNFQIEYLILVTSQFSPRRINVYGFGREKGRTYLTDEEIMKERAEKS